MNLSKRVQSFQDPDQNCLLNSETRDTQPDVFVPEDQGINMVYFDVGKGGSRFSRRLRVSPWME